MIDLINRLASVSLLSLLVNSGVVMDIYGVGGALRGMFGVLSNGARRTGRTSRMLDLVRSGDVILCLGTSEAETMRKALRKRGIDNVRVIHKKEFYEGAGRAVAGLDIGRVHFTHEFVEDHYQVALLRADESLRDIELILCRRPAPPPAILTEGSSWLGNIK